MKWKNTKGLVVVNYPVRDLDRLLTFYKVAQDTERKLVVSLKQAYLLKLFQGNKEDYPKLSDVMIYKPRKGWGLVGRGTVMHVLKRNGCVPKILITDESLRDYKKWEREFLMEDNILTFKDLKRKSHRITFFAVIFLS